MSHRPIPHCTFNQTNTATYYRTGDGFHLEWAATKYLTKQFTIGLVGYYDQQFTPDTGTGAILGPFEGRVVARRRHRDLKHNFSLFGTRNTQGKRLH